MNIIDELRERRWARLNYVPEEQRSANLSPAALDEMARIDREKRLAEIGTPGEDRFVPLDPRRMVLRVDQPHSAVQPHFVHVPACVYSPELADGARI